LFDYIFIKKFNHVFSEELA